MPEEIILIRSNILELINFDAIVCPSNLKLKSDGLLGRKTLNSRIHDIGGKKLDEECKELVKATWITMETGCAVVSKAYNMGFRHIIHAVAPINDEKIIQKIINDIVSTEEKTSKAAELLKNLRITAGEFRYR